MNKMMIIATAAIMISCGDKDTDTGSDTATAEDTAAE
jgi:hypothetical protein